MLCPSVTRADAIYPLLVALQAPESKLLGSNAKEAALVEQWISYTRDNINTHHLNILYLNRAWLPYNKPVPILRHLRHCSHN